jgi:hypothetical protein
VSVCVCGGGGGADAVYLRMQQYDLHALGARDNGNSRVDRGESITHERKELKEAKIASHGVQRRDIAGWSNEINGRGRDSHEIMDVGGTGAMSKLTCPQP